MTAPNTPTPPEGHSPRCWVKFDVPADIPGLVRTGMTLHAGTLAVWHPSEMRYYLVQEMRDPNWGMLWEWVKYFPLFGYSVDLRRIENMQAAGLWLHQKVRDSGDALIGALTPSELPRARLLAVAACCGTADAGLLSAVIRRVSGDDKAPPFAQYIKNCRCNRCNRFKEEG